eukprot:CAMPEP_0113679774 /NCGR_PEP_ID=MMETSP0038_2-20120614/10869_1 /TAXON_ID=2898 /ORGANISM="Cryptomonas paramecium" /LENGTH=146 /DNA_ID=CAMNT_0000597919 /DNA_START=83 /DNA_END=523 /DNA_ORIENTATION=+ /assembly_acc=CAM_ASM_000170
MDSNKTFVLMDGILTKRGAWNTSFKERYFVLNSDGNLVYYHSAEDRKFPERALGVIPLRMAGSTAVVKEGNSNRDYPFILIEFKSPKTSRTYVLGAATEYQQKNWLRALQTVTLGRAAVPVPHKPTMVPKMSYGNGMRFNRAITRV